MTTAKSPAVKARAKLLAAAKRSLTLLGGETVRHLEALNRGEIPDSRLLPIAAKCDQAMASLAFLAELGGAVTEDGDQDNGTAEVSRADLAALTGLIRGAWPAMDAAGDTVLGRLSRAAEEPPFDVTPQDGQGKA
jgi:hypothetical protein